jgi:D-3-phosphoglycerate dehydrogenase
MKFKLWLEAKSEPEALALLQPEAELFGPGFTGERPSDPYSGVEEAHGAMIGPNLAWDRAVFSRAGRLGIVSRTGIGYDNVVVPDATAAGVCVANAPDGPTESTAEFTITLMLAVARRLGAAERRFRAEGWITQTELMGIELAGKTLGVVGLGRIGSRVAEIGRALRMNIVGFDPFLSAEAAAARGVRMAPKLESLLAEADVVTLHLPLSPENRGLMNAQRLGQMKKGAILINAARGPIVVEADLLAALKSGQLFGAGLDVWNPEPTTKDNPLLKLENVVATPHLAAMTRDGRRGNHVGAAQNLVDFIRGGRPRWLVNPEVWDRRRRSGP